VKSPLRNESIFNDDTVSSSDLGPSGAHSPPPPLPRVGSATSVAALARGYEREGGGALINKPLVAQKGLIQTGSPLWEPSKRCVIFLFLRAPCVP